MDASSGTATVEIRTKSVEPSPAKSNSRSHYAAPDEWEVVKPHIKRLYVDEKRKLKDVIDVMEKQYGHRGTAKMFKFRIKRWGFDKNKKKDDMLFVIHKTNERERQGKSTSFTVRGRVITKEEVLHYFERRKEKPSGKFKAPSTPPYISYRTPSPQPQPQEIISYDEKRSQSPNAIANYTPERSMLANNQLFDTEPLPDGTYLSYMKTEDVQRRFSDSPELPYFMALPQVLQNSEVALYSVKTYFDSAVQTGMWVTNEEGFCINRYNSDSAADAFNGHMFAVNTLMNDKEYVEARRTLSQAFDKIPRTMLAEKPLTFHCILYHVCDNYVSGRVKIAEMLLSHISAICAVILPPTSLWRRIWELLGSLEEDQMLQTILTLWKCSIDAASSNLSPYHSLPLSSFINYNGMVCGNDELREELVLRDLLEDCERECGRISPAACRILYKMSGNFLHQKKWEECEIIAADLVERASVVEGQWERMLGGIENLAEAQYNLKKYASAEANIRLSNIELKKRMAGGSGHDFGLFVVQNLALLQKWLREWGREAEADAVKKEMEDWIGHDNIDKELGIEET